MQDVLRLLRIMALFMLLTLVPVGMALFSLLELPGHWGVWLRIVPALAPIVFVFIPGLERRLGTLYLPLALFFFITALAIELTVQASGKLARDFLLNTGRDPEEVFGTWRAEAFLFLLVPVVLAAWAYGRRGALRAATWGTLLHIAGGLWLWQRDGLFPQGYWRTMPIRLTILYAVSLLVAYLATRQRQQHRALEAAHARLRRQAALAEELAASRERNRLARDLHDTLAHSLAGLVVELEAVGTLLDLDAEAARAELHKAQGLARAGLAEARQAICDLRESPAQDLGLGPALHRLVSDFGERTGLQAHTEFVVSGPELSLPPRTADALYRIAQEALSNVARHADATAVTVRLETRDGALSLSISDDGVGFDTGDVLEGRYGLLGIRERADMIGATLRIESEPKSNTLGSSGTRIIIRLAHKDV